MSRIFLLSPANCGGNRARIVMSERATFDLALRLRDDGAPLGEVFSFLSGLYFRGKLAYARAFVRPPDPESPISGMGVFVITPTAGLRAADTVVTLAALKAFAKVDVFGGRPGVPTAARAQRQTDCDRHRSRLRRSPARQHRIREVRGRVAGYLRRAPGVSPGVRRPRRHEPRRPDAALRERRRGAGLRAGGGRRPPRSAAAQTGSADASEDGDLETFKVQRAPGNVLVQGAWCSVLRGGCRCKVRGACGCEVPAGERARLVIRTGDSA